MRYRHYAWMGILLVGISCAWAQISEQRLFTIPYGTGKDQVAVPPLEDTESELGAITQAPATIRRLRTGDFAILSRRHNEGVTLQIFSSEGKLRSYTQLLMRVFENYPLRRGSGKPALALGWCRHSSAGTPTLRVWGFVGGDADATSLGFVGGDADATMGRAA